MSATRNTQIRAGDSLRIIALRELGDAMRWGEIARINGLRPPYIISSIDPEERERGTAIWGDSLQIPIGPISNPPLDARVLYGSDLVLVTGSPVPSNGDWSLVDGTDNLAAALQRRVVTPTGDLLPHATFGCDVHQVLGFKLVPIALLLGAGHIKTALLQDPRVAQVTKIDPEETDSDTALHLKALPNIYPGDGDTVRYRSEVVPVNGTEPLDLNLVLPWSINP